MNTFLVFSSIVIILGGEYFQGINADDLTVENNVCNVSFN